MLVKRHLESSEVIESGGWVLRIREGLKDLMGTLESGVRI